jgi:hypothetical protein
MTARGIRHSWKLSRRAAVWLCLVLLLATSLAFAQHRETGDDPYYSIVPRRYSCPRVAVPPRIDGRLDDNAWSNARWSEPFTDIEGDRKPKPAWTTRVKLLHDDSCLYIGADLEEPHLWATLLQRDTVIYRDNDFEVFLDPDGDSHRYFELEINAYGTMWDLFLPKPYRDGGRADNAWDAAGLRSAVHLDGTINDPRDSDRGWSVELAIPWRALRLRDTADVPPRDGDTWRMNFSRVEWPHLVQGERYFTMDGFPEDNWVWSAQGVVDMHRPEKWGYVRFAPVGGGSDPVPPDSTAAERTALHRVYYAERAYRAKRGAWTASLARLGLTGARIAVEGHLPEIRVSGNGYTARIRGPGACIVHIDEVSRTWTTHR